MKDKVKYNERSFLFFACAVAFLCGIAYFLIFKAPPLTTDAKQFDILAQNLASGKGFAEEDLKPTMFREPAYPYFLSLIYRIFGHSYKAVLVLQSLLFSGIVALTYLVARDIFGIEVARISAVFIAFFPTLGNYAIYLLSEIFYTFSLMAFIFVLSKALKTGSYTGILASALLLAVLTLTKAISAFLILPLIIALLFYDIGKAHFIRRVLLKSSVLAFSFMIFIYPWMERNYIIFGRFSIALRGGKAMYNRAIKLDYDWDRWKKILVFSVSEFLGDKIYPGLASRPSEFLLIEDHMAHERIAELTDKGLTQSQADSYLMKESLRRIRTRPLVYLGQSFFESVKLLGFAHMPSFNEPGLINFFGRMNNGPLELSLIRGAFRLSAYPIFLFFVCGILANLKDWRRWLVMFTVVFSVMAGYGLTFSWGRYSVALIPCYVIFAVAFLNRVFSKGTTVS